MYEHFPRYFFGNFLGWVGWELNLGRNFFFFSFSAYINLLWIEIMPEWCFLIFWIFLLFFLEFSSPGRVRTEFGTNFLFLFLFFFYFFFHFLGLSQPGLDRNIARMMFLNFLNFFAIFFGIFLPGSGRNRIRDETFFFRSWPISTRFG